MIYIYIYKYIKIYKISKYIKSKKYTNVQNMNYGIYTNDKMENTLSFLIISNKRNVFWHCWCIVYNKLLFWISDSDSVYFSVYIIIF